jgi:tripeptide aminopeptidase
MINSMLIANDFIAAVPADEVPEKTTGYEGFFHLHDLNGNVEETVLEYIIRDHDFDLFEKRKNLMQKIVDDFNKRLQQDLIKVEIKNQYFNMKEKVTPVIHIVDIVEEVMKDIGITPLIKPIRGGTDGSQLSYKGLPCPNIFAGGHNFHGRFEYVPVESMIKATEVIVGIAEKISKKYK